MQKNFLLENNTKFFFFVFAIAFTVFLFTSDAHRHTFDEDTAANQAKRIVLQEPHPEYIQDKSKLNFEHERFKNPTTAPVCLNGILCTTAKVMHSITEAPFIFINHHLLIITDSNLVWTSEDFPTANAHYVWWRNSIDPNFTFMEFLYGPFFMALSSSIFFLICRTFHFTQKNSFLVTLFFSFSTPIWAYSQTSLNLIPMLFFILLGYYFFRRFQLSNNHLMLIFSTISLGLGFLSRPDTGIVIIAFFIFGSYIITKNKNKIKNISALFLPLISAYLIDKLIDFIRFGVRNQVSETTSQSRDIFAMIPLIGNYPLYEGGFGLLFSPGVGLFIFAPILLTVFFSYVDFFKRNKSDCIVLISIVSFFTIFYGTIDTWHGLVSWSARYLVPVIPFMLIPLCASIEKRKSKLLILSLISLAIIGAFVNLVYLVQDVSWFIWGWPGQSGLYGIDKTIDGFRHGLNLDPVVMWTFEYSQLTQSILGFFSNFSNDIFLIKILGIYGYFSILFGILTTLIILFVKEIRKLETTLTHSNN